MVVFTDVKKEILEKLTGYTKEEPKTIYEELRLKKKDLTLILYTSGKLLLQGKGAEEAAEQLEKKGVGELVKSKKFKREKGVFIGSDESLKGDTFGGIVVAAVKANEKEREQLVQLGVADSKTLRDKEILNQAEKIRKIVSCEVKTVLPQEYNKEKDYVKLLNWLHQEAADYLKPGKHIVDKFPGCYTGDVQEEKADSKYVEVAAASILARATALKQLDFLSIQAGFPLPKGSSHVKLALQELKERKLDPKKFVKLHFKNVQELF